MSLAHIGACQGLGQTLSSFRQPVQVDLAQQTLYSPHCLGLGRIYRTRCIRVQDHKSLECVTPASQCLSLFPTKDLAGFGHGR